MAQPLPCRFELQIEETAAICENLQTVFPSSFLEGLQSLQILEISSCPSLKENFEMDSTINTKKGPYGRGQ